MNALYVGVYSPHCLLWEVAIRSGVPCLDAGAGFPREKLSPLQSCLSLQAIWAVGTLQRPGSQTAAHGPHGGPHVPGLRKADGRHLRRHGAQGRAQVLSHCPAKGSQGPAGWQRGATSFPRAPSAARLTALAWQASRRTTGSPASWSDCQLSFYDVWLDLEVEVGLIWKEDVFESLKVKVCWGFRWFSS